MAQYFTDFTEYTATGALPSDWTERWAQPAAAGSFKLNANVGFGGAKNAMQLTGMTATTNAVSWNAVDNDANRDNVEIVYRSLNTVQGPTGSNDNRVFLRATGAAAAENGYSMGNVNISMRLNKYVAGVSTQVNNVTKAPAAGTWMWIRCRANGSTFTQRMWSDGTTEPTTWDQTVTDTSVTGVGWVGFIQSVVNGTTTWDCIGIGTNGDTAPMTAVNQAPTVSVGAAVTSPVNTAVTMTASATDPEGGALTYAWTQLTGPTVTISNAATATATVTPTSAGHYSFRVTVTDPGGLTGQATKTVNVTSTTSRPETLVSNTGSWTAQGTTSFVTAMSDESNTTFIQSPTNPATPAAIRYQMTPLAVGSTAVSYNYDQSAASPQLTLTVTLLQGPAMTTIATWTETPTTTIQTANRTLNTTQQAALSDGNNLYADFSASS